MSAGVVVTVQHIEVEGIGPFPIDMLRYDSAWPATQADAAAISNSLTVGGANPTIKLLRMAPDRYVGPNEARWRSHGWQVTAMRIQR